MAITGLSNEAVQNPMGLLTKIAQVLNVACSELHIDNYKVLPGVRGKLRVLLVEFVNKRTRNSWLIAKKAKRDILFSELLLTNTDTKVFINERSTAIERRALMEAKKFGNS